MDHLLRPGKPVHSARTTAASLPISRSPEMNLALTTSRNHHSLANGMSCHARTHTPVLILSVERCGTLAWKCPNASTATWWPAVTAELKWTSCTSVKRSRALSCEYRCVQYLSTSRREDLGWCHVAKISSWLVSLLRCRAEWVLNVRTRTVPQHNANAIETVTCALWKVTGMCDIELKAICCPSTKVYQRMRAHVRRIFCLR